MEFTTRQLRIAARNPAALVRQITTDALGPPQNGTPHDPQRKAIEKSLRGYFEGGRDSGKLIVDFGARSAKWKSAPSRRVSIANAIGMLTRFAQLDAGQPPPDRWLLATL